MKRKIRIICLKNNGTGKTVSKLKDAISETFLLRLQRLEIKYDLKFILLLRWVRIGRCIQEQTYTISTLSAHYEITINLFSRESYHIVLRPGKDFDILYTNGNISKRNE